MRGEHIGLLAANRPTVVDFPLDELETAVAKMRSAMIDFEVPSNEKWRQRSNEILPSLRMATVIIRKTLPELRCIIQGLKEAEPEALDSLTDSLEWTAQYLSALADISRVACSRLVANGAPAPKEDWGDAP